MVSGLPCKSRPTNPRHPFPAWPPPRPTSSLRGAFRATARRSRSSGGPGSTRTYSGLRAQGSGLGFRVSVSGICFGYMFRISVSGTGSEFRSWSLGFRNQGRAVGLMFRISGIGSGIDMGYSGVGFGVSGFGLGYQFVVRCPGILHSGFQASGFRFQG